MNKAVIIFFYLLFHFSVLRVARNAVFSLQVNDDLIEQIQVSKDFSVSTLQVRMVNFTYQNEGFTKVLHYKSSFGSFFLIAIIGLIVVGASKEYFWAISGLHAFDLILSTILFKASVFIGLEILLVCDFMSRYFIPLCSLGIIPIAYMSKYKVINEG